MQREYPDIFDCEKEPHTVQFIPDYYLYGELASKVHFNFNWKPKVKNVKQYNVILYCHLSNNKNK